MALAISRVRSEGGRLLVSFSLPGSEPALLDLFDVGGRRLETWDFQTRGAGTSEVAARAPRAGVYWLRLGQGGQVVSKKIVVLR